MPLPFCLFFFLLSLRILFWYLQYPHDFELTIGCMIAFIAGVCLDFCY